MPITIYRTLDGAESEERFHWLCDDEWDLATQIKALDNWLSGDVALEPGDYAADIGFSPRKGATGGGEKISLQMIARLARARMEVYFSEYDLE